MMWWDEGGWAVGGWLVMSLMMVAFWGALVALVVWLVHSLRPDDNVRQSPPPSPTTRADELLAERFARGEIDEEEFTRRRTVLRSS